MLSFKSSKSISRDLGVTVNEAKNIRQKIFTKAALHPISLSVIIIGEVVRMFLLKGKPEILLFNFISIHNYYFTFVILIYAISVELICDRFFRKLVKDSNKQ